MGWELKHTIKFDGINDGTYLGSLPEWGSVRAETIGFINGGKLTGQGVGDHDNLVYIPAKDITGDCVIEVHAKQAGYAGICPALLNNDGSGVRFAIWNIEGDSRQTIQTLYAKGSWGKKISWGAKQGIANPQTIKLMKTGSIISIYIDDVLFATAPYNSGSATPGLVIARNSTVWCDSVKIYASDTASPTPDPTPTPTPDPEPDPDQPASGTKLTPAEPTAEMKHKKCVWSMNLSEDYGAFGNRSDAGEGNPEILANSGGSKYWKQEGGLVVQQQAGNHWDYFSIGGVEADGKTPINILPNLPVKDFAIEVDMRIGQQSSHMAPALMTSLDWSNSQGGPDTGGFGRCIYPVYYGPGTYVDMFKLRWVVNNDHDLAPFGPTDVNRPDELYATIRLAITPINDTTVNVKCYYNGVLMIDTNDSYYAKNFTRFFPGFIGYAGGTIRNDAWVGGARVYVEDSVTEMDEVVPYDINIGPSATVVTPGPIVTPPSDDGGGDDGSSDGGSNDDSNTGGSSDAGIVSPVVVEPQYDLSELVDVFGTEPIRVLEIRQQATGLVINANVPALTVMGVKEGWLPKVDLEPKEDDSDPDGT